MVYNMRLHEPAEPSASDPNSQNPIPTGLANRCRAGAPAPPNPPKPPRRAANRSQDIRKAEPCDGSHVSLSMVGVLGLGTGIAVASAVSANDKTVESSQSSLSGGTTRNDP